MLTNLPLAKYWPNKRSGVFKDGKSEVMSRLVLLFTTVREFERLQREVITQVYGRRKSIWQSIFCPDMEAVERRGTNRADRRVAAHARMRPLVHRPYHTYYQREPLVHFPMNRFWFEYTWKYSVFITHYHQKTFAYLPMQHLHGLNLLMKPLWEPFPFVPISLVPLDPLRLPAPSISIL